MTRPGEDALQRDRRAGAADRDGSVYARKRWAQQRRRTARERTEYDPAPPGEDDWVVPDEETDGVHRVGAPIPVGDSLTDYVARRGWDERLRGASAWARWDEIVGQDLAQQCEPVRLAGGRLVVRAVSQPWATQLRYLLPQLRANIERALGEGTVTDVRVVVGPLEGRTQPDTSDAV